MRFNIVLTAGEGFGYIHFLFDSARTLNEGLRSMGHDSVISLNRMDPSRVNVLVASHTLRSQEDVAQIIGSGIPYVVQQSEVVRDNQVNLQGDASHYQDCYLPLLRGALSVWEALPDQVPILEAAGVPAQLCRVCHHPVMEEIRHKNRKDLDFLFYGSVSDHRLMMLKALRAKGAEVAFLFDGSRLYRNDLIARARVHLAPRRAAEMHHLAYWRLGYLAANACVTVVERCTDQAWLEDCFVHGETDQWVDLCLSTLERPDLTELGANFQARYRERSMVDVLTPLVEDLSTRLSSAP